MLLTVFEMVIVHWSRGLVLMRTFDECTLKIKAFHLIKNCYALPKGHIRFAVYARVCACVQSLLER